jgi:hypothetical protein
MQLEGVRMRIDVKIAIVKSGRKQWEIAHEAHLHESRLSRYVNGHERLRPEEEQRL